MRVDEIRALTTEELKKQLEASHKTLFELRVKLATKQLVNHRQIWRVKKDIARMETVLRERELSINVASATK